MNIKSNFVKVTAAAALTLTGVAAVNVIKPDSTNATVQAATTKVKINYIAGYGINIWDNYNGGHFTGQRAQHGTTWNVFDTKTDKKGRTWYQIGDNQWILAQYTVDASSDKAQAVKKAKKAKKSVQATGDASAVITLASAQLGKSYVWVVQELTVLTVQVWYNMFTLTLLA